MSIRTTAELERKAAELRRLSRLETLSFIERDACKADAESLERAIRRRQRREVTNNGGLRS